MRRRGWNGGRDERKKASETELEMHAVTVPGCGPAALRSGPWSAWACGESLERNGSLKSELVPRVAASAKEGGA